MSHNQQDIIRLQLPRILILKNGLARLNESRFGPKDISSNMSCGCVIQHAFASLLITALHLNPEYALTKGDLGPVHKNVYRAKMLFFTLKVFNESCHM